MQIHRPDIISHDFRLPNDQLIIAKINTAEKEDTKEKNLNNAEILLCRQCRQVITSPEERIAVQGAHQHTFANPNGIVYQIECFKSAIGCEYTGQFSAEWSWFKDFLWRIAVCRNCFTHLGWLFASTVKDSFTGLIADRLILS